MVLRILFTNLCYFLVSTNMKQNTKYTNLKQNNSLQIARFEIIPKVKVSCTNE